MSDQVQLAQAAALSLDGCSRCLLDQGGSVQGGRLSVLSRQWAQACHCGQVERTDLLHVCPCRASWRVWSLASWWIQRLLGESVVMHPMNLWTRLNREACWLATIFCSDASKWRLMDWFYFLLHAHPGLVTQRVLQRRAQRGLKCGGRMASSRATTTDFRSTPNSCRRMHIPALHCASWFPISPLCCNVQSRLQCAHKDLKVCTLQISDGDGWLGFSRVLFVRMSTAVASVEVVITKVCCSWLWRRWVVRTAYRFG